jgi:hypothetical protein
MPIHTKIKDAILDRSIKIGSKKLDMVNRGDDLRYRKAVIAALVADETVPFCFADAGIAWDGEAQKFTYPEIASAEIELAEKLPLPHARMLIETKVEMPAGSPTIYYIWIIERIGASGYTAIPALYYPDQKALIVHNVLFDFVPGRIGNGSSKSVHQLLNKQNYYYPAAEFGRQRDLLCRFFCLINRSRILVQTVQVDAALNKRRVARGRTRIRDYHVVRLGSDERSYLKSLTKRQAASPCEHRRRSHLRRYRSGRVGIVRNSIVNAGKGPNGPVRQVFMVEPSDD